MIVKLKNNFLEIISFLILLVLLIFNSYSFINNINEINKKNKEAYDYCLSINYKDSEYESYCNNVLSNQEKVDFFTVLTNIVIFGYGNISYVLFLFITIPSLYYICKYLKNNFLKNELTRCNYKVIKKRLFKKAYLSAFILPTIIIISFIISYLYTGTFNADYAIKYSTTGWSANTLSKPILFIIVYVFNIFIHSLLYVNIGLLIVRKYNNYFIAVISSFLMFIGIEAILEILFNGIIFTSILKSSWGHNFNIINMLALNDQEGIYTSLIVPFILLIISYIALHILYNNKEKLVIYSEKN